MASRRGSLIRAASKGHLETLKGLLLPDPSASLQEAEFTPEKPFAVTARHQHYNILKFCISIEVNVNDDAVRMGILQANRLSVYKVVIAAGFGLDYDQDGTIGGPLIWTTLTNDIPLLTYLKITELRDLQHGAYRPLAKAAEKYSIEMIELFLQYGAQIARSGALIVAAEHGKLDAVQCLVFHGANIDLIRLSDNGLYTKSYEEESALHKAFKGGHEDVVAFLVDSGA